MSRIFDTDPALNLARFWHWDDEKEQAVIETRQDVTVASIPLNVYYDLKQKGIIDDAKAFKRWLNDSENRFFRTKPGKV